MLRDRDFAHFFAGYATSLLGTSMSALAVSFAVLDGGGTASDLGLVLAAGIIPQVLFMLGGGVLADRVGRRPVMLGADAARCAAQAALAGAVLAGRPALWVFVLLAVVRSGLDDLREGWAEFRGRAWLVITTVQFTLFNLLTWGPFLLLGPVLCRDYLGGAGAWGAVMACYGAGSVLGSLLALGRRPHRPMAAATAATFGYGLPCALLALHAPVAGVAAGALAAGTGSALAGTFSAAAEQQQLPAGVLARVSAFQGVTAFAFGPLAFAAAGPVAAVLGARTVLGFGAIWSTLSCAAVLALPAVRAVTVPPPARAGGVGE